MFTAIITAARRGFGLEQGDGYSQLNLGFISFAFVKGTLWEQHTDLKKTAHKLKVENDRLMELIK